MGIIKTSGKYAKFVIYIVAVILINVAGMTLFFRWDLTTNRMYTLSEASKDAVATLSEPLTIHVFFTKNLPAPHNGTERYLRDLLEEYAIHANRFFNYRFFDVSPEEGDISEEAGENQRLARNYGIHPLQIQVIEEDEVKFQKAYMGLVMIHGDLIERLPSITSTEGLEYALTSAIQKLNNKISALLSLNEKIKVKLFLSSSLSDVAPYLDMRGLADLADRIKDLVGKLNRKNYDRLLFDRIDPSKEEGLEETLKKYNILTLKWPRSEGKFEAGRGAIGLIMEYGDKWIDVPLINVFRIPLIGTRYEVMELARLEEILNENLESLIDINEDLGYLADHGTPSISDPSPMVPQDPRNSEALTVFPDLISRGYSLKEVRLKETPLDKFNCLIISGPREAFSEYELFQIDQFLMQGKSLALFLDPFNEVLPPQQAMGFGQMPQYLPLDTGLEKLLEYYGVRLNKAYVMDENCLAQRIPSSHGGGETPIYFAPLIKNEFISKDIGFMRDIKEMYALKVAPLELDRKRLQENGLKATPLFSSSKKSWEMRGRINLNPMLIQPPPAEEIKGSMPLACLVEGEFPSYFKGKPIPEKETEEESTPSESKEVEKKASQGDNATSYLKKIEREGGILTKGKPGKIIVIASSEMMKDPLLDPNGRNPNAMFLLNVVDYLNNREDVAQMRGKELRFNPLNETGPGVKTFVKFFNIAGLPILVSLFGLGILFRRHARKRRIRMMFSE